MIAAPSLTLPFHPFKINEQRSKIFFEFTVVLEKANVPNPSAFNDELPLMRCTGNGTAHQWLFFVRLFWILHGNDGPAW